MAARKAKPAKGRKTTTARKTTARKTTARKATAHGKKKPAPRARAAEEPRTAEVRETLDERLEYAETSPALTGGDLDADWQRAASTGEEAVGGSVATPDQDIVDELGRALGVEQPLDAPVRTSDEILRDRDARQWELERRAERRKTAS